MFSSKHGGHRADARLIFGVEQVAPRLKVKVRRPHVPLALAFDQRAHVLNREHDAVNSGVLLVDFKLSLHLN